MTKPIKTSTINPETRYRVAVHRSNKYVTAQIIDDLAHVTIASVGPMSVGAKKTKTDQAIEAANALAAKAIAQKIKKVMFDRRTYRYHGRIKMFAETLRKQGLEF